MMFPVCPNKGLLCATVLYHIRENRLKNKLFTREFAPAAQIPQVERKAWL